MTRKRALIIVLDGVGAGALPDAADYGDTGACTLAHCAEAGGGLRLPALAALGLGNILPIPGVPPTHAPRAAWGRMAEKSPGKDSTTGHWELAGLIRPFPPALYPDGFPDAVMDEFQRLTGLRPLGNKPASGTEIIRELGEEHLAGRQPIVYTSADSVLQIAAHRRVTPPDELYRLCRIAREEIMNGRPWSVDRVIARPFDGEPGAFFRTPERKDFSIPPPGRTLLDICSDAGARVAGVGKIAQLFSGRGVGESHPTRSNREGIDTTFKLLDETAADPKTLVFVNLIEFDQNFGHRRDAAGFRAALEEFDAAVPLLLNKLQAGDLMLITADHGCDPAARGSDHTREYAPVLAYRPGLAAPRALGERGSFADAAATVAEFLEVEKPPAGDSFLEKLRINNENSF